MRSTGVGSRMQGLGARELSSSLGFGIANAFDWRLVCQGTAQTSSSGRGAACATPGLKHKKIRPGERNTCAWKRFRHVTSRHCISCHSTSLASSSRVQGCGFTCDSDAVSCDLTSQLTVSYSPASLSDGSVSARSSSRSTSLFWQNVD